MRGRHQQRAWRRLACAAVAATFLGTCSSWQPQPAPPARSAAGLAYDVTGDGPTVVLIHGTNLDRRLWDGDVEWLVEHARVVRYDLRGHGASDLPTEPYSNHGDLLQLLDELGETEVDVVGLSAGAQVALDLALAAPERTRRLVLVSPSLFGYVPQEMPPFFADLGAALKAGDFRQANEVLLASPIMAVPDAARERVRAMVVGNERLWTIPPNLLQPLSPLAIERLEEIGTPALVLVGEDDLPAVRAQAELLEQGLAKGRRVEIDGGGHLLNLTSPEAFRREVADFLGMASR